MKQGIHPKYYPDAKVSCASCGKTWTTGSTKKEIRVEICSNCHPFFSGESARMIDIEGQVDRFYKKLQVRQSYVEEKKSRADAKVSPKRAIAELELGTRSTAALEKAGITEVGQFLAKLGDGEAAVLGIDGFGRKSLIDIKKKLRALGYELPAAEIPAA
jgi:large subunit ribosomal protein L31